MTHFSNFADLASHIAAMRENEGLTQTYECAFIEHNEMAKLSVVDAPEALDMPDPEQVRAATEMMMATMFDVLRDTRIYDVRPPAQRHRAPVEQDLTRQWLGIAAVEIGHQFSRSGPSRVGPPFVRCKSELTRDRRLDAGATRKSSRNTSCDAQSCNTCVQAGRDRISGGSWI